MQRDGHTNIQLRNLQNLLHQAGKRNIRPHVEGSQKGILYPGSTQRGARRGGEKGANHSDMIQGPPDINPGGGS